MARRSTLLLSALLAVSAFAQPASAQEGSGLYEPFPGPVTEERAVEFVQTMVAAVGSTGHGASVDAAALDEGIAISPSFASGERGGASARGDTSADWGGSPGLVLSIALVLLLGAAPPIRGVLRT